MTNNSNNNGYKDMKEKLAFVAFLDSRDATSTTKLEKRKYLEMNATCYVLNELKQFVVNSCCGEGTKKKD